MSWNYNPAQMTDGAQGTFPGSTIGLRNQIRLLLLDNVSTRPLLQDEEIDWLQTQEMNAYMVAAACCRSLIARSAGVTSKRVGDLGLSYDPKFYLALKTSLEARGMNYQVPYVGGTRISDKIAEQADIDAVVPRFFITFGDNPEADQPAPGDQLSSAINNPNAI